MDVREQITALREQLRYHNEKYYNEDAPEITDYEYDMLQRQLRALEAEHPEMADANSDVRLRRHGEQPVCQGDARLPTRKPAGCFLV